MAKFCINCGNPLEEGQVCSCHSTSTRTESVTQTQPVTQQTQAQQQVQVDQPLNQGNGQDYSQYQQQFEKAKQDSSIFLKRVFSTFKSILRSPATEGTKFVASENMDMAIGLLVFQGIFSALFALVVTSKINSTISKAYSAYSMFNRVNSGIEKMYKMPLFKIFLLTVIMSVILSCALAGLLLLANKLFKNNTTYKSMICVAATRSVAVIPVTIVAIVLFYINVGLGLTIFYTGNLAGLCYMVSAFPTTTSEIKNRIPAIVFIASLVFLFVSMYVMYKAFPGYLPAGILEGWGDVKKVLENPSEIFNEILGDLY